jgi:hypothetical protein
MDNASALPTCPQLQQKQQQTADLNWLKDHPHDCAKKQNKYVLAIESSILVTMTYVLRWCGTDGPVRRF